MQKLPYLKHQYIIRFMSAVQIARIFIDISWKYFIFSLGLTKVSNIMAAASTTLGLENHTIRHKHVISSMMAGQ